MHPRTRACTAIFLLATGPLGGCGGARGPGSTTLSIPATATVDGFVREDGLLDTGNPYGLEAGDSWDNHAYRGFLRFPLAGVPAGKTITSAHLSVHQWYTDGSPYAALGNLIVDHVNIGTGLNATDYASAALATNIGTLSTTVVLERKVLDVTLRVMADLIAARIHSDFRLRFLLPMDGDSSSDFAAFNDAEDHRGSGEVPLLTIVWED